VYISAHDGGTLINWYYKHGDEKIGPVTDEQIKELARIGRISAETPVWNEIIAKWRAYGEINGAGKAAAQPRSNPDSPFSPPTGEWSGLQQTADSSYTPEPEGNFQTYEVQKPESYCNRCFRKFPASEMKQTEIGPVCAACSDAKSYALGGSESAGGSSYRVEFTGSGREYFRIWIVNLFLSIITLGIYSAWAKVRKNKYFYRNTRIAGSSFDYHGNPRAILKGRIVAVIILAALYFSQRVHPGLYVMVGIIVGLILPWMIARSFAFRLCNTSWRGIRMRFHGSISEAYITSLLYGFLTVITLGICFPLLYRQIRLYLVNNAAYGTTRGELTVSAGRVYGVFIRTILIGIAVSAIMSVVAGFFFNYLGSLFFKSGRLSQTMIIFMMILFFALYLFYRVIVQSFFRTHMANLMWDHCKIGSISFEAGQRARDLASIIASNALLTFVTLGFYWPWARIQLAKYYADTLVVHAPDGLNNFVADVESAVAAAGDEVTEALDVDFSF
jgi:uncharacterized membrane protein YjgN (DUF898 family)